MKKSILLMLAFIAMFFVGNSKVLAFDEINCQVGETYIDSNQNTVECLDELKSYLTEQKAKIRCLYEVELENGEKYYNYIYQYGDVEHFYGGTTLGSAAFGDLKLNSSGNPYILGVANENLYDINQCPANSYIDTYSRNAICFDNNGECRDDSNLDFGDTFKKTISSKFLPDDSNMSGLLYRNLSIKNYCENSKKIGNFITKCSYLNQETGDIVYLLYDNNRMNNLIFQSFSSDFTLLIGAGQSAIIDQSAYKYKGLSSNKSNFEYRNLILTPLNTCPDNLYLKLNKGSYQCQPMTTGNPSICTDSYYTFSVTPSDYSEKYTLNSDCKNNTEIPLDPIEDCDDLITDEIREVINDVMNIIRIAIPIILIGLIIYDFAQAVFAADDKGVDKAKKRAIKRIIIAVVIFFVPTLVNFLLNIVNEVWGKNFSICNLE